MTVAAGETVSDAVIVKFVQMSGQYGFYQLGHGLIELT